MFNNKLSHLLSTPSWKEKATQGAVHKIRHQSKGGGVAKRWSYKISLIKVLLENGWTSKRMITEGDAAILLETTRHAFGNQEKSKQISDSFSVPNGGPGGGWQFWRVFWLTRWLQGKGKGCLGCLYRYLMNPKIAERYVLNFSCVFAICAFTFCHMNDKMIRQLFSGSNIWLNRKGIAKNNIL